MVWVLLSLPIVICTVFGMAACMQAGRCDRALEARSADDEKGRTGQGAPRAA